MPSNQLIPLQNYFAETLRETLEDWEVTQKQISTDTGIIASHLSEMKTGKRRCTPEYDLRLSRYFGIESGYFLRLQLNYDLEKVQTELGDVIQREVHPAA